MMNDNQRAALGSMWDADPFREALTAFFEDRERGLVEEIRNQVAANDIVGAAIAEGRLRELQSLPKDIELKGVTRTGNS